MLALTTFCREQAACHHAIIGMLGFFARRGHATTSMLLTPKANYFDCRCPNTLTRLITETKTTKITMPHPDVIGWCKNSPIFCTIS
jgi:hypothetical protein